MTHIFFIDPISKLNIKKDSSLMMALSLKNKGKKAYLLFEDDFYVSNSLDAKLKVYDFNGHFKEDGFYINDFELAESIDLDIDSKVVLHMRIDPPYDQRYQRYLWMLDYLQTSSGATVLNNPLGIMKYNEKLSAFALKNHVESYVGSSMAQFKNFVQSQQDKGIEDFILKPLDLYSGIGVKKVSMTDDLEKEFNSKVKEFGGAIIAQPFLKEVLNGEYRSIYFDGIELGTIIKKPRPGEYLTNIAQGAMFEKVDLPDHLKKECQEVSNKLSKDGVRFIAFDLLGNCITEINVTCPGLLVEVSYAHNKNFADIITDHIINS
jgi:glutathione synthase